MRWRKVTSGSLSDWSVRDGKPARGADGWSVWGSGECRLLESPSAGLACPDASAGLVGSGATIIRRVRPSPPRAVGPGSAATSADHNSTRARIEKTKTPFSVVSPPGWSTYWKPGVSLKAGTNGSA